MMNESSGGVTRRRAVALWSAAGVLAAGGLGISNASARNDPGFMPMPIPEAAQRNVERIIDAKGQVSDHVFSIVIDRSDITATIEAVPIEAAFEINGQAYFQRLADGRAMMNGCFPLKTSEVMPFVDALLRNDIIVQAEHQHFFIEEPVVWFVHFRQVGDPEKIARGLKAAFGATAAPFPQAPSTNKETPLPAERLGAILGAKPSVGSKGIVSLTIPRADAIVLGGVRISPYLNVSNAIAFQPHGGGTGAIVACDFSLVASEIQDVLTFMRSRGWLVGCLYNQETDEMPQLYYSHMIKVGDSIMLAQDLKTALERTNAKVKS